MSKPTEDTQVTISAFVSVLSTLGIFVAGYLTVRHFQNAHIGMCPVFGDGCDIVTTSKYSMLFGFIPLALMGLFYYAAILLAQTKYAFSGEKISLELSAYISTIGALFSLYLLYLQAFVIGAYCFYCVSSAVISLLIFFLEVHSIWYFFKDRRMLWKTDKRVEECMTILLDKTEI